MENSNLALRKISLSTYWARYSLRRQEAKWSRRSHSMSLKKRNCSFSNYYRIQHHTHHVKLQEYFTTPRFSSDIKGSNQNQEAQSSADTKRTVPVCRKKLTNVSKFKLDHWIEQSRENRPLWQWPSAENLDMKIEHKCIQSNLRHRATAPKLQEYFTTQNFQITTVKSLANTPEQKQDLSSCRTTAEFEIYSPVYYTGIQKLVRFKPA